MVKHYRRWDLPACYFHFQARTFPDFSQNGQVVVAMAVMAVQAIDYWLNSGQQVQWSTFKCMRGLWACPGPVLPRTLGSFAVSEKVQT